MRSLCVFCGSQTGRDPEFAIQAQRLGRLLAERGCRLVYGGGRVGLMGIVADAVLAHRGQVTGVIPEFLARDEVQHDAVTDMRVVPDMHTRKAQMAAESDAFLALPGGFGTFEELLEVITWAQLGIHQKPIGLLNVSGYFDGLLALFDHACTQGLLRAHHRQLILVEPTVEGLLRRIAAAGDEGGGRHRS